MQVKGFGVKKIEKNRAYGEITIAVFVGFFFFAKRVGVTRLKVEEDGLFLGHI